MNRSLTTFLAAAFAMLGSGAWAGQYNRVLNIGDRAPAWRNLPGVDGKSHALADLKDKDVVVVVFICNHCPIAQAYEERLIAFVQKHGGAQSRVALVAISVDNSEEDRLPKMKEHAQEKGFNFPYLHDTSQKIGRDYGASVTPEFFVLNKERKIVYMGAMDDNIDDPKVNYLEPAMQAAVKGEKPAKAETRPFGCALKYESR
jgi:peroxiredoxin